ncbi:MAG: hypothetical protein M1817_004812 [Caeruleum heppii]|nr:MAG: hypothetical protein M1817_004812 [Caeruleum heppii]
MPGPLADPLTPPFNLTFALTLPFTIHYDPSTVSSTPGLKPTATNEGFVVRRRIARAMQKAGLALQDPSDEGTGTSKEKVCSPASSEPHNNSDDGDNWVVADDLGGPKKPTDAEEDLANAPVEDDQHTHAIILTSPSFHVTSKTWPHTISLAVEAVLDAFPDTNTDATSAPFEVRIANEDRGFSLERIKQIAGMIRTFEPQLDILCDRYPTPEGDMPGGKSKPPKPSPKPLTVHRTRLGALTVIHFVRELTRKNHMRSLLYVLNFARDVARNRTFDPPFAFTATSISFLDHPPTVSVPSILGWIAVTTSLVRFGYTMTPSEYIDRVIDDMRTGLDRPGEPERGVLDFLRIVGVEREIVEWYRREVEGGEE